LECPLKLKYPALYKHSTQHNCTVEEIYHGGQWSLLFFIDFSQIQDQLGQLRSALQHIQLQNRRDEIRWTHITQFTPSAYYRFIQDYPSIKSSLSQLWKLKAPPRVQIFTCLMLRNAILTVDNLKKRGWQMINMCHMCYNAEEIVHNLFAECQYIKEIRFYIHDVIQNHRSISTPYRNGRNKSILDVSQNKHWRRLKIVTCFVIWRERCARIFRDENKEPMTIVRDIMMEYQCWFREQP
jgi:zinc-binding in reverse transcriptase